MTCQYRVKIGDQEDHLPNMRCPGLAKSCAILSLVFLVGCGSPQERALKSITRFEQFYAVRDFVNARTEIQKAIAIEDDVAENWNRLGRAELGLRNYYAAYTAYQRALELDSNDSEALQAMAEIAYSGGKPEDAVKLADKMLEKHPRTLRMLLVKAAVAVDNREFADARGLLGKMLEIDPDNEAATVLLGRMLSMNGEPERGAALVEGSIQRSGVSMLKLNALVDNYTAQHDLPGIIRTYRRLFAIDRTTVGLRLDYAKALYDNDRPAQALAVIDQLQRARPHDIALKQQIVELWDLVGPDAIDLDQIRRFAEAGNDEMKLALARLAVAQGRFADAVPILRPYVTDDRITPDNVDAQMLYAEATAGLGQTRDALARANRVLAFDSTNPAALVLRVNVSIAAKKFEDALNDAQILGRDNPASPPARLALAHVYVARGERMLADTSFARALGDIPDSSEIVKSYTDWLMKTGRPQMALDVAARFTDHNPRLLKGWDNRARLCMKVQNRDCMAQSAQVLAQLHDGERMHDMLIAALAKPQAAR